MNSKQYQAMMREQMVKQPRTFARNAINSGQFGGDELHRNALELVQSGNEVECEKMVRKICEKHGVSVDDAMNRYQQMYVR